MPLPLSRLFSSSPETGPHAEEPGHADCHLFAKRGKQQAIYSRKEKTVPQPDAARCEVRLE
ncbi:hypothetical protein DFS30_02115 [Akkermansia muciniphila]|nr:hypothetical protein [Akkermansia muciniphila]MBE5696945.1 hypothetical protein [Akkermansia sp.]MBD9263775.1 hypothetical protein [Akkermansia muciniphila]PNC77286.1 hypothetical protein CXT98_09375 [Akkermansia muciniphila]PNC82570.1 hypothetical protein CXT92_00405 [Akkermansia muciniphila]